MDVVISRVVVRLAQPAAQRRRGGLAASRGESKGSFQSAISFVLVVTERWLGVQERYLMMK